MCVSFVLIQLFGCNMKYTNCNYTLLYWHQRVIIEGQTPIQWGIWCWMKKEWDQACDWLSVSALTGGLGERMRPGLWLVGGQCFDTWFGWKDENRPVIGWVSVLWQVVWVKGWDQPVIGWGSVLWQVVWVKGWDHACDWLGSVLWQVVWVKEWDQACDWLGVSTLTGGLGERMRTGLWLVGGQYFDRWLGWQKGMWLLEQCVSCIPLPEQMGEKTETGTSWLRLAGKMIL